MSTTVDLDQKVSQRSRRGAAGSSAAETTQPKLGLVLASLWAGVLKVFWRATRSVRRPVVAKLDRHVLQLLHADFQTLSEQLNHLSAQVTEANASHVNAVREMNVFVDGMLREVARLQSQVLTLSQICSQNLPADARPAPWYDHETEELAHSP